jgi:hypothetical protein
MTPGVKRQSDTPSDRSNSGWSLGFKTAVGANIVDQNRILAYFSWSTGS